MRQIIKKEIQTVWGTLSTKIYLSGFHQGGQKSQQIIHCWRHEKLSLRSIKSRSWSSPKNDIICNVAAEHWNHNCVTSVWLLLLLDGAGTLIRHAFERKWEREINWKREREREREGERERDRGECFWAAKKDLAEIIFWMAFYQDELFSSIFNLYDSCFFPESDKTKIKLKSVSSSLQNWWW